MTTKTVAQSFAAEVNTAGCRTTQNAWNSMNNDERAEFLRFVFRKLDLYPESSCSESISKKKIEEIVSLALSIESTDEPNR